MIQKQDSEPDEGKIYAYMMSPNDTNYDNTTMKKQPDLYAINEGSINNSSS